MTEADQAASKFFKENRIKFKEILSTTNIRGSRFRIVYLEAGRQKNRVANLKKTLKKAAGVEGFFPDTRSSERVSILFPTIKNSHFWEFFSVITA